MSNSTLRKTGPTGVLNNAGGTGTYAVTDSQRLMRFLILGCEGGSYYSGEPLLIAQNAEAVLRLIQSDGKSVVDTIIDVSTSGRAAKQGPTLFALAMCARLGDEATRKAAYTAISQVCRIPTHLFTLIGFIESLGEGTGWGRGLRRAVSNWYSTDNVLRLAYQVTKYQTREGWSHVDILRLAHVKPTDTAHALVLRYLAKGWDEVQDPKFRDDDSSRAVYAFLASVEEVKGCDESRLLKLIREHRLAREHLPTTALSSAAVWDALLNAPMPYTAMIRNLAKMTAVGLLRPLSESTAAVCRWLKDPTGLEKARVHPFNVLVAMETYKRGEGIKGSLRWVPVPEILAALDDAFYLAFKSVVPTGKRFVLGMDVSGSMGYGCVNGAEAITPAMGAAALAMQIMRKEPKAHPVAFSHDIVPLPIHKGMSLNQVMDAFWKKPMGTTNCAAPMQYAARNKIEADVFVVLTDCETWSDRVETPAMALRRYREEMNIPDAKLIVIAMTSGGFTIADPNDPGMLDMVGFDSSGPAIMREFIMGNL